ncbi:MULTISPECIES: DUF6249 domain-containing protein [Chitinophagaceae]
METQNLVILWLIITCVSVLATIFGIAYLKNKENMSLIARGINPKIQERQKARPKPFGSLRIGMPLIGAGLGLLIASLIDLGRGIGSGDIPGVYFGLIIALGGLGFFLSYKIEMKWWKEDEETRNN